MRIVLWSLGIFRYQPYLRCIFMHNTLKAYRDGINDALAIALHLLWDLYNDNTNLISRWEATCRLTLVHENNISVSLGNSEDGSSLVPTSTFEQVHVSPNISDREDSCRSDEYSCDAEDTQSSGIVPSELPTRAELFDTIDVTSCKNDNKYESLKNTDGVLFALISLRHIAFRKLFSMAPQPSLFIAPSNCPFAGLGLFLCGSVAPNTFLGDYIGESMRSDEAQFVSYALEQSANNIVDATRLRCSASMANDYRDGRPNTTPNAHLCTSSAKATTTLRSTRWIKDEEILINYGPDVRHYPKKCIGIIQRTRGEILL